MRLWISLSLGTLLLGTLMPVLTGCSSSSEEAGADLSASAAPAKVDLANTRDVTSLLESSTVSDLEPAWSSPMNATAIGLHYIASPVVHEGVVYLQDQESNVEAIDLATGELKWEAEYRTPTSGPGGVIVADGTVFGATPYAAFALDANTGKLRWTTELVRNTNETIAMVPGYRDGRVYVSTAPSARQGNEVGVLWALDARSGRKIWHFDTVPRGLWKHPEINFGGGLFYPPAFDGEGSMYVGISYAGPIPGTERYPWGSSRPGANLYSNSIVRLDEKTGKVQWHYQLTPHGICTGFLASPILVETGNRRMVVAAGTTGIVVALDRKTGEELWKKPVGVHNGHDNDGLEAMRGEYESLKIPATVYPGAYGGVSAPMSVDGQTLLVPVLNAATRLISQEVAREVGVPRGELVALELASGATKWKRRFPAAVYGPPTVTNDLVFVGSYDGMLFALDAENGAVIWTQAVPAEFEGVVTAIGDTLLVRAGGKTPELLAYRLSP